MYITFNKASEPDISLHKKYEVKKVIENVDGYDWYELEKNTGGIFYVRKPVGGEKLICLIFFMKSQKFQFLQRSNINGFRTCNFRKYQHFGR